MKIQTYKELIRNLPYNEQAFSSKKTTWDKLKLPFGDIFGTELSVFISRKDIFDEKDEIKKVLKTIIWGYPRGVKARGPYLFAEDGGEKLQQLIQQVSNDVSWEMHIDFFEKLDGISLATYSKFLYFFKKVISGHRSLILDSRIVEVIGNSYFVEFDEFSPELVKDIKRKTNACYPLYLEVMAKISERYELPLDSLELFIFQFGGSLKG